MLDQVIETIEGSAQLASLSLADQATCLGLLARAYFLGGGFDQAYQWAQKTLLSGVSASNPWLKEAKAILNVILEETSSSKSRLKFLDDSVPITDIISHQLYFDPGDVDMDSTSNTVLEFLVNRKKKRSNALDQLPTLLRIDPFGDLITATVGSLSYSTGSHTLASLTKFLLTNFIGSFE
jgi:hypothetical protein